MLMSFIVGERFEKFPAILSIALFLWWWWSLQWGVRAPLEVFKTVNKGWGVRATKTIEPEEYICTYAGEVRLLRFPVFRKAVWVLGICFIAPNHTLTSWNPSCIDILSDFVFLFTI